MRACVENDGERSRGDADESPPTADVAQCDLLAQLGVLLADSLQTSSSSAAAARSAALPPPPRSTSSPGMMLRPDDSVPSVDSSAVPNDNCVDSETVTSGMSYITIGIHHNPLAAQLLCNITSCKSTSLNTS